MPAIEPDLPPGNQRRQRPLAQQLQPRRPARLADAFGHGFGRDRNPVLMPQHRHRQRGIIGLMRAGQRWQGQA